MRQSLPAIFATEPHESRSSKFVHISSSEILEKLDENGFLPVEATVSRSRDLDRRAFTKHAVRLRRDVVTKVGDSAFEIVMRNAHDGTGSYRFMGGLFRFVCLNGMTVGEHTIPEVKVIHSGNKQRQLDQVVEGVHAILDQAPRVAETVRSWQQIELKPEEQRVYAEKAHRLRFADAHGVVHTPIEPTQLLHPRRAADTGPLWATFQRVQENVIRGGLSAIARDGQRWRRATTREVTGIDSNIGLNRALWSLTEKMAELKAA
jgi:hypothetical protein